jgi:hypothetical protein
MTAGSGPNSNPPDDDGCESNCRGETLGKLHRDPERGCIISAQPASDRPRCPMPRTCCRGVAKTTGEIVRAAGGMGAYLGRVLGSIPDNLLGLVAGDWLERKPVATLPGRKRTPHASWKGLPRNGLPNPARPS